MTLTTEQSRSLVDAIAITASLEALVELQRLARREHLLDPGGGFLELLIAVRHDTLTRASARAPRDAGRVAAGAVPRGKGAIARSRAACVVGLHTMERARLTAERSALLLADSTAARIGTQHTRAICDELRVQSRRNLARLRARRLVSRISSFYCTLSQTSTATSVSGWSETRSRRRSMR